MLLYLQHCDKVMNEYPGMSAKVEGRSQVYAQIVGEVVEVYCNKEAGFTVFFDKKPTEVSLSLLCHNFIIINYY